MYNYIYNFWASCKIGTTIPKELAIYNNNFMCAFNCTYHFIVIKVYLSIYLNQRDLKNF